MQASYPEAFPGFGLPLNHTSDFEPGNTELIPTGLTKGGWTCVFVSLNLPQRMALLQLSYDHCARTKDAAGHERHYRQRELVCPGK